MATLTLRSQKGSPLTNQEVDDNFSNLNSSKVETVTATSPVVSSGGTAPVISLSDGYGDTKNPYASKTANYVLAAPNGSNGTPSFRALVAGDIPTLNQNTTGSAASLSATLAVSSGGTGVTTAQAAMNAFAGAVTSGQYLRGNGTNVVMSSIQASDIPTLNQNTTGSAASLSATLAVSSGGTGQTTYTNGQLLIGNTTGNTLTKATLTAGTGISITNGTGSITIASTVTGTVTSVSGTGTVSGLTLTGTVTGSGSLTLGGTLSLTSAQVTGALGYTPYNSTNPSGYITGYTETDTLATVTARGATTTSDITINKSGGGQVYLGRTHNEGGEIRLVSVGGDTGGWIQGHSGGVRTVDHSWTQTTWNIDNAGNSVATSSHRAPIFYDSNNTAYYVNPNSTTNLSTTYLQDGKFFTTSNGSGNSIDIYMRPHGDNTYVWRHIYGGSGTGYGTGVGGYGIYNETLGGDYSLLFNYSGYVTAPYSLRAPIFYDSNNTAYYGDFASTSTSLNIAGGISTPTMWVNYATSNYNGYNENIRLYPAGNNVSVIAFGASGASGTPWNSILGFSDRFEIRQGDQWQQRSYANYMEAYGSYRAPIFYDSNDTGYYVNPNSNSSFAGDVNASQFYVGGWFRNSNSNTGLYNQATTQHLSSNTNGFWDMSSTTSVSSIRFYTGGHVSALRGYVYADTSNNIGFLNSAGSWRARVVGDDYWLVDGSSARAPLFYDNNDTAYYGDFASTSNINALQTAGQVVVGGTFANNAYSSVTGTRLMFGGGNSDAQDNYYIGTNLENYGGNYNKLDIRWHTGIRMGAQPNYGGIRFYDTEDLGTQIFAIGKDGSYAQANQSMRAPIFYDLDDTGYYVNPNSNSSFAGSISISQNNATGGGIILADDGDIVDLNDAYCSMRFSFGVRIFSANRGGSAVHTLHADGNAYFNTSARSPIFYDNNDTNYYCDPNGTSRLNNITTNDGNLQLYKAQTVDMSNTGVYSTSNYYPVIIGVPTGGCWIEIQNNLNSNVPSWATHGGGFTLNLRWWTNGSGWGTTELKRRVEQYHERFTNQTICGGISQLGHSSEEVVWLRGGGVYYFYFSRNVSASPQSSNYTNQGLTASVTSSAVNTVWDSASGAHTSYNTSVFADTRIDAPIFYDRNDTGYYCDPNSTSNFIRLNCTDGASGHYFRGNGNTADVTSRGINVYSEGGSGAVMAFHRGGYYAVNMGLDSDNVIRIGGWSASSNRWQLDMSGNGTFAGNVTAYSDLRLKDNIETITDALNKVKKIRGITYTRNDQQDKIKRHTGVVAQEVQQVLPEVVSVDNEGILHVAYGNMVGLLVEAVKEQQQQIDKLTKLVEALLAK